MCKIIGFILFWIGVGIIISLCLSNPLFRLLIAGLLLVTGYNLFCKTK